MNADISPPAGLLASLQSSAAPRVLLVRHSDRYAITTGDSGFSTPLTEIGEVRARSLQRFLGAAPTWGLSSPLIRCTRTVELVGASPEPSALLGAPGPFVVDRERGAEVFGSHGTPEVVRGQITGKTWGCMRSLAEGSRLLYDLLLQQLTVRGGTGIAASHDAIVMPFIAWATGYTFEEEWLAPLDGIIVSPDGVVWRGQHFEVPR